MPRSPRTRHVRFYDILRQICRCPTGGQRRPPLQGCYEVAEHCAILQLRTAGSMRRPRASFEAQPRAARLLAPKMGIDPYKHFTVLHWCIRFCGCVLPGGQGRPPLRVRACLHWCGQICSIVPPGGVEPLPYANLAVFAIYRKLCDFAGASWRVDATPAG